MDAVLTPAQLSRWRLAVFAIFLASGLSIATWASRVPAIKVTLDVDNIQIGLMMLVAIIVFAVGVAIIGIGTDVAYSYVVVVAGLVLFGMGNGAVDVMMNVEGAAIEKQTAKPILPLFHAFFSFGTVIGAGLGALAAAWGLNVLVHTSVMAVV